MIIAADDMRDAHIMIIDHHSEHICRAAIGAQQDEIIDLTRFQSDLALNMVGNGDFIIVRCPQPDRERGIWRRGIAAVTPWRAVRGEQLIGLGEQGVFLRFAEVVSLGGLTFGVAGIASRLQFFWGGIAPERLASGDHLMCALGVPVGIFTLKNRRFIGRKAEPGHAVQDGLRRFIGGACLIGIFNAEQKFAAMTFGEEIVEKCRARAANMQHSGGGRGKPRNDCHRPLSSVN